MASGVVKPRVVLLIFTTINEFQVGLNPPVTVTPTHSPPERGRLRSSRQWAAAASLSQL